MKYEKHKWLHFCFLGSMKIREGNTSHSDFPRGQQDPTHSFVNSQGYEYFTPSLKNVHLLSAIKWWDNDAFENQHSGVAKKTWALPHCDPMLSFLLVHMKCKIPLTIEQWILGILRRSIGISCLANVSNFMEWHTQLWLHLVQTSSRDLVLETVGILHNSASLEKQCLAFIFFYCRMDCRTPIHKHSTKHTLSTDIRLTSLST